MSLYKKILLTGSLIALLSTQIISTPINSQEDLNSQPQSALHYGTTGNADYAPFDDVPDVIVSQILDFVCSIDFKSTYILNKRFHSVMNGPRFWYSQSRNRDFILTDEKFNTAFNYRKNFGVGLKFLIKPMPEFAIMNMNKTGNIFAGTLARDEQPERSAVYNTITNESFPVGSQELEDSVIVHSIDPLDNTLWGYIRSDHQVNDHFKTNLDENFKPQPLSLIHQRKPVDFEYMTNNFQVNFLTQYTENHEVLSVSKDGHIIVGKFITPGDNKSDLFISVRNKSNTYNTSHLFSSDDTIKFSSFRGQSEDGQTILLSARHNVSTDETVTHKESVKSFIHVYFLNTLGVPMSKFTFGKFNDGLRFGNGFLSSDGKSVIGTVITDGKYQSIFQSMRCDNNTYGPLTYIFNAQEINRLTIGAVNCDHRVIAFRHRKDSYIWSKNLGTLKIVDLLSDQIKQNCNLSHDSNLRVTAISNNGGVLLLEHLTLERLEYPIIAVIPQLLQR